MDIKGPSQDWSVMMREGQGAVYLHIPPPGMELGQMARKLWWEEKMDGEQLSSPKRKLLKDTS